MQKTIPEPAAAASPEETLMQFLYRAPIGLLQTSLDGAVESMNPTASNLLVPLSAAGSVPNLFVALREFAPQLQPMVAAYPRPSGTICESLRVLLLDRSDAQAPQILFVSLFKLNAERLIVTVSDVVFQPAQERAARRRGLETELRQALEDRELFLQYQPVVGLRNPGANLGAVDRGECVEVLMRWNHRIRGAVSPLEFISVAEESGLIGPLSEFVLRTACGQFIRWQLELGALAPRRLAVNLSRGQLALPGLVGMVRGILDLSCMAPAQLQLEVNESLVAQNEAVLQRLHELKELGVTLALDNFGTGHSSLTGLRLLPVNVIKIDRSFVTGAVDSAYHRVLIDATVRVAKSLNMKTAAEGIETEAQVAVLRQLGCESGQGYFFSEAISPANVAEWLTGR